MDALIIIPARLGSTRLPGKMLRRIGDRSLLEWTWRRARQAELQVVIATDSDEIEAEARKFGGTVIRTPECHNGTERCDAAMAEMGAYPEFVINWQGDSPCIPASVARLLAGHHDVDAAVWTPVRRVEVLEPGQSVAVLNRDSRALLFTRQPVPTGGPYWAHVGMYCYRLSALARYGRNPSRLEVAEGLEQNRWIEAGEVVRCVPVEIGSCREVNELRDVDLVAHELGVCG